MHGSRSAPLAILALLGCGAAVGSPQSADVAGIESLPPVEVVGSAPLPGAELPARLLPYGVAGIDLRDKGRPPVDALADALPSASLSAAQNNPLQPDFNFRSYTASPLLGLPQGIAVYVDGMRVNEAFGDTVNWDLLPLRAVARATVVPGSSPVYGRNALGGAVVLATRTGFDSAGTRAGLESGSSGRRSGWVETGGNDGRWGWFGAIDSFAEDGWREASPTTARHAFASLSRRGDVADFTLKLAGAHSRLVGNGATPVEALRRDWRTVFTTPDETRNRSTSVLARVSWPLGAAWRATAAVARRSVDTRTFNGDTRESAPCEDDDAWLCEEDGGRVLDPAGAPVSSAWDAVANHGDTRQRSRNASLQLAFEGLLLGRRNHFVAGAEASRARVRHAAGSRASVLAPDRSVADGIGPWIAAADVDLRASTRGAALYASDTWEAGDRLALTLSGRYDRFDSRTRDPGGDQPDLDGDHRFAHFSPALGMVWTLRAPAQLHAAYGESMRAPTAVELTCADEEAPCRLPNAFLADPPLRQVVARHWTVGARSDDARAALSWHALWFRSTNVDDILFQATGGSSSNEGFFANVGDTRRQGVEFGVRDARDGRRLHWHASYVRLDAVYLDGFTEASGNHPDADADGLIRVAAGNRIPGLPRDLLKAGIRFAATDRMSIEVDAVAASEQSLRGDEANRLPRTGGYAVVDAQLRWQATPRLSLRLRVENLFDRRYATFGALGEPDEVFPGDEDPRFLGPAAPRGFRVGVAWSL